MEDGRKSPAKFKGRKNNSEATLDYYSTQLVNMLTNLKSTLFNTVKKKLG